MIRSNNVVQKTASAASNARSAVSAKPSQWLCKHCGFTNLAANSKCACGAFKSGGSYAGSHKNPASGGAKNCAAGGICQITDQ